MIKNLQHTQRDPKKISSQDLHICEHDGIFQGSLYAIKHSDAEFIHGVWPEYERNLYEDVMYEKRE